MRRIRGLDRRRQNRAKAAQTEALEQRTLLTTLQLLHASDLEAGVPAIEDAPRFSAVVDSLRGEFANTLLLSSGDNFIPGPVFDAGEDPAFDTLLGGTGIRGRADIGFMNAMGFDASVIGNHEFDAGPGGLATAIGEDGTWPGADFPYLSANLDFTGESDLQALVNSGDIRPWVLQQVNGELFGIIGATTPLLDTISSPGGVGVSPSDPDDLAALAAIIQNEIDVLEFIGVNHIILVSHLQQLSVEQALIPLLDGVDIVIAGGSDTLLADSTDILRPGDVADETYPLMSADAAGDPVAIVSTDGQYSYVGRLVVEFDANGTLIPASIDEDVSGAFATDGPGVDRVGGTANPEVVEIAETLREILEADVSQLHGRTEFFLNGTRADVRTQETNLGNLTADANLAFAKSLDDSVMVSLKNGGGIRADIGFVDPDSGEAFPPQADQFRETGQINQLEIDNTLRFNNGLSLLDLSAADLLEVIEHGVSASGPGETPGRFPQIGGMRFSFDERLPAGERVQSLAIVNEHGEIIDIIVEHGEVVGDPDREIRIVTLGFLAGGGDGYPFDTLGSNVVDTGIGERQALKDYLDLSFDISPFAQPDLPPQEDFRIQQLTLRPDEVLTQGLLDVVGSFETGVFDEGAAEIVAYDPFTLQAFFTNSDSNTLGILDLFDPSAPVLVDEIDLSPFGGGPNSVAVFDGLVAVAVEADTVTDPGSVVFFDTDGFLQDQLTVGALPDMLTFTPDGSKLLVANEGEPDDGVDPEGSVSIIDLSGGLLGATVTTADFTAFNGDEDALRAEGVRIFPGIVAANDFEPEYIAVSPDGTTARVAMQEANAFAVLDLTTDTIVDVQPLGLKDHSLPGNGLDASDRDDEINIQNWPVFGMFMPDAITSFEIGGETFFASANEGDARDEDDRVKDLTLDPTAFPNAADLQMDENLGRLEVSLIDGDTDGDGDFDQLFAYGSRSFTIWDTDGNIVFDSGDDFEQITAKMFPEDFNSSNDDNDDFDSRSDAKGPEPEAITTGVIGSQTYAFIGLERMGGVMVYDITDPAEASFVQYLNNRDFSADADTSEAGDLGPEDLKFVPAIDSPTGSPVLISANEVSGTVTVFEVTVPYVEVDAPAGSVVFIEEFEGQLFVDIDGETALTQPVSDTRSLTINGLGAGIEVIVFSEGNLRLPDGLVLNNTVDFESIGIDGTFDRDMIDIFGSGFGVNGLSAWVQPGADTVEVFGFEGEDLLGVTRGFDPLSLNNVTLFGGDENDHFVLNAEGADLTVHGEEGSDTYDFSDASGGVRVDLNRISRRLTSRFGRRGFRFSNNIGAGMKLHGFGVENIIGSEFNDKLTGDRAANIINGGGGRDLLIGGRSSADRDVLVGGDDRDVIRSHGGSTIMIGGLGADIMIGGRGSDLLIGGETAHDNDLDALRAISDEWSSGNSYEDKIANLQAGVGLAGVKLDATTVDDDLERDILFGRTGRDWFLSFGLDLLPDRRPDEQVGF